MASSVNVKKYLSPENPTRLIGATRSVCMNWYEPSDCFWFSPKTTVTDVSTGVVSVGDVESIEMCFKGRKILMAQSFMPDQERGAG